jgi:electron transport complex protein RnfA
MDSSLGMSAGVIVVMFLATIATWPIQNFILWPLNLGYLQIVIFVIVIATIVQFIVIILQKFMPSLYKSLGVFLPLMTTNCAILGVVLLNVSDRLTFTEAIINSLGAGFGFMLAMVLFTGIRQRLEKADIPKSLQGLPITLIAAAFVAIAFLGFSGLA